MLSSHHEQHFSRQLHAIFRRYLIAKQQERLIVTPRNQSPAERVFSLLELCEPILEELPIQDLIRVSRVSRTFLTNLSSSKLLRQRILRWRECDLNDLALNDDYASFPTGFVSSFDFDTPYLRTREPPWIFHTVFGYGHGLHDEERKNLSAENGILVIYRCTEAEEYFVYVPFSIKFPVMALRLSKLVFDHASYTFKASWSSRLEDWNGDSKPAFTESYQGRRDYSAFVFAYFQTWYTTDIATSGSSSLASERMANTEISTRNAVNWKHWAQVYGKVQPLPEGKRGWKTWLQHKGRKIRPSEKTAKSIMTDAEELDLKFSGPVLKHIDASTGANEVIDRHGHIRDGYQTDLRLHMQRSYILKYGNPIREPELRVCYDVTQCTLGQ